MKKQLFMIAGVALASIALTSQAAVIADWDFSGVDYTGVSVNDSAAGSLIASTASGVAANATSTDLIGSANLKFSVAGGGVGELNLNNFGSISFTIDADAGYKVDLTSIDLSAWRNGGGAAPNFTFQVSIDGGALQEYGTTISAGTPGAFTDYTFTETLSSVDGGTAEIFYAPTPATTGNIHVNGLTVNGGITAIPEPATLGLVALFGGGIVFIRRRRMF